VGGFSTGRAALLLVALVGGAQERGVCGERALALAAGGTLLAAILWFA
jgi:hypothetical protein